MERNVYKIGKELFITSDEEEPYPYALHIKKQEVLKIKCIGENSKELFHDKGFNYQYECKKIILTTDQDLINDGVQAIDDEFLEWFVKNPSCEKVEVEKEWNEERIVNNKDIGDYSYKIILPQEEPKQIKCYCGHTITCDCQPKQETLEDLIYQAIGLAANKQGIINQALATSKVMDVLKRKTNL
jgi:hypothetical protein